MNSSDEEPVRYYLVGPTGAGKKDVAVQIAPDLNCEIISLDSMKVYRGVDIGTTTPDDKTREKVPFHLINIRDPEDDFSVAEYIQEAKSTEKDLRERGKRPLFVGGTGMYLDRLMHGLFEGPEADWDLRESLKEEAEEKGSEVLHERLRDVDPDRAEEIHPNDVRRIVRALEVYQKTGTPMSQLQEEAAERAARFDHRVAVLDWPREELYRRINERVERMMDSGWLDEARDLKNRDPSPGRHVMQAVGYEQLFAHLDGERELDDAVEQIKQEHRNLAKRQLTWFRSLEDEVHWVELDEGDTIAEVSDRVKEVFSTPERKNTEP